MQKFCTDNVSQPRSAYYFGKFALISIFNPQTSFCRKTSGGTLGWAPAFLLFISTEHRWPKLTLPCHVNILKITSESYYHLKYQLAEKCSCSQAHSELG